MSENLKTITIEEIEQKIHNHQLWLKGDSEDKKADFNGYDLYTTATQYFNDNNYSEHIFEIFNNKDLSQASFKCSNLTGFDFTKCNLKKANFKNSELYNCTFFIKGNAFYDTNLELADFRGASYNFNQFTKTQKENAIFTDTEYNEKVIKKIKDQEREIKEKNIVIENTNEEQTDLLINSFYEIKKDFSMEERRWLFISFILLISLLITTSVPIIDIFAFEYTYRVLFWCIIFIFFIIISGRSFVVFIGEDEDEDEDEDEEKNTKKQIKTISFSQFIWKIIKVFIIATFIYSGLLYFSEGFLIPDERVFKTNIEYGLIPLLLLLFSFIYFSICQYSKAKELRIENQNKIALLHGFQAISSNELIKNKDIFYANIAHVVFTKAYNSKNNQNLPIDKIIELINISRK